jgi:DNA-binding transcriptional regulator YiaG
MAQPTPELEEILKKKGDGLKLLAHRYGLDTPEARARIEQLKEQMRIAQDIHALRTAAGLSQAELARRIGTSRSVISRLESATYSGHSVAMLRRVAAALDADLQVRLVPRKAA